MTTVAPRRATESASTFTGRDCTICAPFLHHLRLVKWCNRNKREQSDAPPFRLFARVFAPEMGTIRAEDLLQVSELALQNRNHPHFRCSFGAVSVPSKITDSPAERGKIVSRISRHRDRGSTSTHSCVLHSSAHSNAPSPRRLR